MSYDIEMICTICKANYDSKPGGKEPGLESHGICNDCIKVDKVKQGKIDRDFLKHIEYINNPNLWDRWPFCPLFKRDKAEPNNWNKRIHGVVSSNHRSVVKDTNIFMLPKLLEEFNKLDGWVYDSVAAMVADGWEVD